MNGPLFFAPMEGITDFVYRYYLLTHFPDWDYSVTDFLRLPSRQPISPSIIENHIGANIFSSPKLLSRTILQLLFSKESNISEAICLIQEMGLKRLDLNLGCPSKKVNAHGGGAFLLQDLTALKPLIQKARSAFQGTLSAKIRIGYKNDNTLFDTLYLLQEEGIDLVTIHGRTKDQLYHGQADWGLMEKAAQKFSHLAIVGNGDITTPQQITQIATKNLFHGFMIGRGALTNPWLAWEYKMKQQCVKNIRPIFNDLKELYLQNNLNPNQLLKRFKALAHYMINDRTILRCTTLESFFEKLETTEKN